MIGAPKYSSQDEAGKQTSSDYRERIYAHYSSGRHEQLAPFSMDHISTCPPYLDQMLRRHFPPDRGSVIIDLGCGYGTLVHFARNAGYTNISGVDSSPEQVDAALRLGIDGIHLGDAVHTLAELPDKSHDLVITFDVIEHFSRSEVLPLVDGVQRVLRDGGRWIIHTVNGESPLFGRIRYGDLTHEMAYTRTSLGQLLLSSGFRQVNCFEDQPVVHGVTSAVRYVIWKLLRASIRLYLAAETGSTGREAIFSQNFLAIAVK